MTPLQRRQRALRELARPCAKRAGRFSWREQRAVRMQWRGWRLRDLKVQP